MGTGQQDLSEYDVQIVLIGSGGYPNGPRNPGREGPV